MVAYDRALIQQFAEKLYAQARTVLITWALLGLVIAFIAAASLGQKMGIGEAVILGGIGALVGYVAARSRAFTLRLQAQTALCQAQIEENTRPRSATVAKSA
jgi:uncharacterized membrane protein YeaQ/YmgE (transglycosylase-associated protein family)